MLIEKYYPRLNPVDFHTNKRVIDEVAIIPSKRLRNKIAGFTTHLMKRIQKGPVRGISFKLQEEERERKVSCSWRGRQICTRGVERDCLEGSFMDGPIVMAPMKDRERQEERKHGTGSIHDH